MNLFIMIIITLTHTEQEGGGAAATSLTRDAALCCPQGHAKFEAKLLELEWYLYREPRLVSAAARL